MVRKRNKLCPLDVIEQIWNEQSLEARTKVIQIYKHETGQVYAEIL